MAELAPVLKQRFFDANGDVLSGGKLWSYQAGTTTPKVTYTDRSGTTPNTNPVILDANGEAEVWIGSGYYKFILMDDEDIVQWTIDDVGIPSGGAESLPSGGLANSVLTKDSDTDFDFAWKQYSYSGFSSRFGEAFDSSSLDDTLQKILDITYTAPLISLSASGSSTIREKGDAVTSTTLSATVTKRSDPIEEVRFYQGVSLVDTETSPNPAGGVETYGWTGSFTDTTTFKAEVDDNGLTGGPTTVTSNIVTFTFVYPYYYGADSAGISAAAVSALTKYIITSNANVSRSFTAGAGDVLYFAYPASYGALTSILDENGFETFGDWTLRTENITGLDASSVSYRIYEFNNPLSAGTYTYTFKR